MEDRHPIGRISIHKSEVGLVVEWEIADLSTIEGYEDKFYWSDVFHFGGERWELGIYPNGWSHDGSAGYVDLELIKNSSCSSVRLSFSLSLKTAEGKKHKEKHYTKDFDDNYDKHHTFHRFISTSELVKRRPKLVPDDVLTVACTMKRLTPVESDGSRKWYWPFPKWNREETATVSEAATAGSRKFNWPFWKWNREETATVSEAATVAGDDTEHAYVGASTQNVSIQNMEASIQTVETSTQTLEVKSEVSSSGSSTILHENKLQHDFKKLFLQKEDCDVTFIVEGSEFLAHSLILKARSPVFASTLRQGNGTGIIEIDDCDSSSFSDFLYFLYCGDFLIISQKNAFGLFTAADKYQVSDLRAKCLDFMKSNLTVDTFYQTLTLALRHFEAEQIELCTDYFQKNASKIIVTAKWQIFLAENPVKSNELLVKFSVPDTS